MEDQASSKSIILNNGLYYGLILVITSLIIYALGMHLDTTAGYVSLSVLVIVLIAFPIIGMSKFKKDNNGFMSWGQGVKIGVGIVLIGTLISILYNQIFSTFIEPDFYAQVEEVTRTALEEAGRTEEQIEAQISMSSKFQGTMVGDALGLLFFAFIGFIVSAIVAAVKKHSEEDAY
jgi:tetrahydromethanopterin S-methyltransferase subunit G